MWERVRERDGELQDLFVCFVSWLNGFVFVVCHCHSLKGSFLLPAVRIVYILAKSFLPRRLVSFGLQEGVFVHDRFRLRVRQRECVSIWGDREERNSGE